MLDFLKDIWAFMRERKKFWMAPIIIVLVLLGMLGFMRTSLTLTGKRQPNSFDPGGADVSPFSNRLCRAHANCYESFPIFGGLLLLAIATNNTAITDGMAAYFVAQALS